MSNNENKHRGLMVVGYHTSAPVGGVKDDRAVSAVADAFKATHSVGTFTRRIIPPEYIRPFTQARNKWAKYHRQVLVPYSRSKKGTGIGKAKVVIEYVNEFRHAKREVYNGIDSIIGQYDAIVRHQRENSGDLFIPSADNPDRGIEIPEKEIFRASFVFELIDPMALENPDELIDVFDDDIVQEVRDTVQGALEQSVRDSLVPVFSSLRKMSESLKAYDPDGGKNGAFRKTLVTNLKENAELLSKVNFTDDETISHIQNEILGNLVQFDERQLKDSETLRQAVAVKVDQVIDNFEMFGIDN